MARSALFTTASILDATARIAAQMGPQQATMARIAQEIGAPTGSLYHRFASRDALLAEVWLGAAQSFQRAFGACLEGKEPWAAGIGSALLVLERVQTHPIEARILLQHRREDFVAGAWPQATVARAAALRKGADAGLAAFATRLLGRADANSMRGVRLALVDVPLAAVLPHLRAGEALPAGLDALVRAAVAAVFAELGALPARDAARGAR
jgi:AcrR family transcriptional regulator